MFEVGKLIESDKQAILIFLHKSLDIEYAYTIDYPRIIDILVNGDQVPDPEYRLRRSLETLAEQSVEHLHATAKLIDALGDKPQWRVPAIERIVDVHTSLLVQLESKKASVALFEQAINVATSRPSGLLGKVRTAIGGNPTCAAGENSTVRLLERLSREEQAHVAVLKGLISEFNIQAEE